MSAITLRGPVRVVARMQRRSLWTGGALVVLGIAFVIGLRIWVASAHENCPDGDTTRCGDGTYLPAYARTATQTYLTGGGTALLVLSVLVGVFVAGPLIARELESGTFRFAWAQSVSPARWLAARLAVPALLATAGMTVLVLVYRWGRSGVLGNAPTELVWSDTGVYPALGPVALAHALFAIAVGALCAVLVRRTLPAMALTAIVVGPVMYGFGKRRYELWPTVRGVGDAPWPGHSAWNIESGMLTSSGKELYWKDCFTRDTVGPDCLRDQGGVTGFVDYHPVSHFWPLQLMETGILLVLAAAATALAFRVLRRYHA
ncbi:ABC transporter permease [Streptomyces sp. NBC_00441]|uniref:ABC transporter permease n=1 Tax=Streptomyces sp. NBC_00441 TaxID=2975742 RepID=UPI002E2A3023|nr:ABC transporter permease [Streptomyces sp. NBC_00441]